MATFNLNIRLLSSLLEELRELLYGALGLAQAHNPLHNLLLSGGFSRLRLCTCHVMADYTLIVSIHIHRCELIGQVSANEVDHL